MNRNLFSILQGLLFASKACITTTVQWALLIILFIPMQGFSQTGPGGVGRNDGTSHLKMWYRTDWGLTTTGNKVDVWKNAAGTPALDLAASGDSRPQLVLNALNGLNVVHFTETHFMEIVGNLTTSNFISAGATIYLVMKSVDADYNHVYTTVNRTTGVTWC